MNAREANRAPGPAQTYVQGDRVRIRTTGDTGTVTYARDSHLGLWVTVRLDAPRGHPEQRTHRFLARNVARIETLF